MKKMENRAFSEYFTDFITRELLKDPGKDVTTIDIVLKLSNLKSKHGKVMCHIYDYLKFEKGTRIILSDWKAAAITTAIKKGRTGAIPTLNLYI